MCHRIFKSVMRHIYYDKIPCFISMCYCRMGTILPWDDDFDVLMDEDDAEIILQDFNRTVREIFSVISV